MREEREFFNTRDLPWEPYGMPGYGGCEKKLLSRDSDTQATTMLVRFPKGYKQAGAIRHEVLEEVYLLEGLVSCGAEIYGPGYYTCRPPGMVHGPFEALTDTLSLVIFHGPITNLPA